MKKKSVLLLLLLLSPTLSVSAEELDSSSIISEDNMEIKETIPAIESNSNMVTEEQQQEQAKESPKTGWIEENGHKYYLENGVKVGGFKKIGENTYFFSRDKTQYGVMKTGKFQIGDYYYCFDDTTGAMYTGIFEYNGQKYYANANGELQLGYQTVNGKTYFFSRDKTMYGVLKTGKFEIDGQYRIFNESLQTGLFEYNGKKYYADSEGNLQLGFQTIDGKKYFFSRDKMQYGVMRTGKFQIGDYYYCFDDITGEMLTGLFEYNGQKYYANDSGELQLGYQEIDGKTYFFSRDKTMYGVLKTGKFQVDGTYKIFNESLQTGLFEYEGNKYYANSEGVLQGGFQIDNGNTYFFSRDNTKYGVMRTGKFQIGDYYYCFDDITGEMLTGLFEYNGQKYYANANGKLQLGYQTVNGKTYFFSRDKTMYGVLKTGKFEIDGTYKIFNESLQTGLFEYEGNKYFANSNGVLQTGFQTIDGKRYFFSGDKTRFGVMRYGWIQYNQYRYYLDSDGTVVTGYKKIDGRDYMFDDQGRMNTGFVTINGNTYYYYADGTFANDWLQIGDKKYFFNSLGVQIGSNVKKVIDVSYHQGIINWDKVVSEGKIDGVILRIAAGCEEEDTQLARNISELKRLGIPYGIYIYSYAENYNEGRLYAEFTINIIKKYNMNPTLGIYLDLESNSVTSYMGVTEYTNVVNGYMDVMKANGYGDNTKIYTYKNYADTSLNSEYLRSLIAWVAQYNHYCTYTGSYVGWQYSSTERIPGIDTNVDISVWFN